MNMRIYAINLDRSADRWARLSEQADQHNLELIRVAGIDGHQLSAEERLQADERSFGRNNGRSILPGEYGCYQSHLKALCLFLRSNQPVGIIVEDDIEFSPEFEKRVEAAFEASPKAEVIKLLNHRIVWFKHYATSVLDDEIGRAAFGPQGSTACYAVTREGARKLVEGLECMAYPWDIALERGWATGINVYTTRLNLVDIRQHRTTIANRATYKGVKFPWWKRLATLQHRIVEGVRRINYALRG
jgi:glycosyl transferase family 25